MPIHFLRASFLYIFIRFRVHPDLALRGKNIRIYHDFVQGQGNPPECHWFAVHDQACRVMDVAIPPMETDMYPKYARLGNAVSSRCVSPSGVELHFCIVISCQVYYDVMTLPRGWRYQRQQCHGVVLCTTETTLKFGIFLLINCMGEK